MVLGLSTSSDNAAYWYRVNLVNLYSSRYTANTDECTNIVVKKMCLKALTIHDQHPHWSAQFSHEILYHLRMCMGWFMRILSCTV